MLVVDDLLAHVDGRAVQVEGALDGLDGAVDAGAVAARGGEQELFGGGRHQPSECRQHGRDRFATGVEALLGHGGEVVAGLVAAGEVPVDQVDRGHAALLERRVVVARSLARRRSGSTRPRPPCARRRRAASPRGAMSEVPSRGSERFLSATKSSRIIAFAVPNARAATLLPRIAAREELRVGHAARGLLAVEQDELHGRADRARLAAGARAATSGGRAAGAVVRAEEAGDVLRVVVRADHDEAARVRAGHGADDVAQAAGHRLEAAVRQQRAQLRAELPQRRRAGRARPVRELQLQEAEGGRAVEAVRPSRRSRRCRGVVVADERQRCRWPRARGR